MTLKTVKTAIIEQWLKENAPFAQEKLVLKAQVAATVINQAKRGVVPASHKSRRDLATALGVTVEELFPVVSIAKEAS